MAGHSIIEVTTRIKRWRDVYNNCEINSDFNDIKSLIGEPDSSLSLGEVIVYSYISEEWRGYLRGGTLTRKLIFVVDKNGKIISKSNENLDRSLF